MKELIIWDDKYLTDVKIIDSQHLKIFKCVNELYDAVEKMEAKERIIELIGGLDFYTTEHFDCEEKYMTELNYPEYAEHKEIHNYFKKIYEDIRYHYIYKEMSYVPAIYICMTIKSWLDYHLQNEDQKLAKFLISRNIEN